ncbi:metal-dependent transcriptional regulator [Candidatus Bathyarchaeota archaeon]|nr:MAG: metal-dependent transcriptional regulator [Candidatus Bathyarchaeota archaeon]
MGKVSKSAEDYLEAIYVLSREKGYARVLEIARALGVRPPSVTQMLKKLRARGLVLYERYGVVRLTEEGLAIAKAVLARHESLKELLVALGVSEAAAEADACAMEHVLHEETVAALRKMADFLTKAPEGLKCLRCIREGKHLCLSGE